MKQFARIAISTFCAVTIAIVTGWWYLIHYARTTGFTEQNINQMIWTIVMLGLIASVAMAAAFYRMIR